MKKYKILTLAILMVVSIGLFMVSCKKPQNPKAIVTVTDDLKMPIPNASVRVFADVDAPTNQYVKATATTDAYGIARFEFKYEGILSVEATATRVYRDTVLNVDTVKIGVGRGILILENDKTEKEEIQIPNFYDN